MAVKDHSLDEKIIDAATAEFMEHGFRKTSLRRIAARAGLTTGALYTRSANKDQLFSSLVSGALNEIKEELMPMRQVYMDAQQSGEPEKIMEAIRKEERICLEVMFKYYDQCILFFCRSDGSSVQQMLQSMMEYKAKETVEYFKSMAKKDVDFDGIEFIMSEQFHYYRQILERAYSKEKAMRCMQTVESFLEAGWKDFFEKIM